MVMDFQSAPAILVKLEHVFGCLLEIWNLANRLGIAVVCAFRRRNRTILVDQGQVNQTLFSRLVELNCCRLHALLHHLSG